MGDRINIYFKQSESGPMIRLYCHWSGHDVDKWLSDAIEHARPRWSDPSYGTRMIIGHILHGSTLDELGYGISAETDLYQEDRGYRVIDFVHQEVLIDSVLSYSFEAYVGLNDSA